MTRGEMFSPGAGPEARRGGATVGWGASSSALHRPMPAAVANMASDCTMRGRRFGHAARVIMREIMILDKIGQRSNHALKKNKTLVFRCRQNYRRVLYRVRSIPTQCIRLNQTPSSGISADLNDRQFSSTQSQRSQVRA